MRTKNTPILMLTAPLLGALVAPHVAAAQDSNIMQSIPQIEELFEHHEFKVIQIRGSRAEGDRTYNATLNFDDGTMLQAKIAPAPKGGGDFNNRPRYEIGAYETQKLFIEDAADYVVPPTLGRCLPLDFARETMSEYLEPTFDDWRMVLTVMQYWLWNAEPSGRNPRDFLDEDRFESDEAYRRHMANFNLLTYLIHHGDSNEGNFLRSVDPNNPRVFAVDNGISFMFEESDRGTYWRDLHVEMLPRASVERLRSLTEPDYHDALGVIAQFELDGGQMQSVEPTANLNPGQGIRRAGDVLQLGLTDREIRNVIRRATDVLKDVDQGKIELF